MGKKIRLAVVGCGGMEGAHERALAQLHDRIDPVAAVDIDPERARRAAEAMGAPLALTDYHEVLDKIDAALLVLPHHLHHEVGMACLRAGRHVLMEKPLAITERQCLDLIHASEAAGLVLMTAYPMRFHPLVVELRDMIRSDVLGDVFQVSIWTEQLTHRPDNNWYNAIATLGGGQLFSHGCHYIDLLLWLLGSPVRGTHSGTRFGTEWMEREGTSNVSIEFRNGALGYHFGTWGARGSRLHYSIHAHGTKGMAEVEFRTGALRVHNGDTVRTLQLGEGSTKRVEAEIEHFAGCVESGGRPLTDGPGSLQGLRVIWRLYEAEQADVVADLGGLGLDDPWDKEGLDRLPKR